MITLQEKTKTNVFANFLDFMADCARDESLSADFIENPRQFLNEKLGLSVSSDVEIVLEESNHNREYFTVNNNVLYVPFFDVKKDILTTVEFSNADEVVLSCC